MKIEIENITWNVKKLNEYDKWDEFLGMSHLGIPENMLKRFIKECAWEGYSGIIPHYDSLDMLNVDISDHDCINTDTQIVLMNWLHDKRRKYKLDYRTDDPFWIFHDHKHSQNDVYRFQVSGITSTTEYTRLMEGAEMAMHYGTLIKPQTVIDLLNAWHFRFRGEVHAFDLEIKHFEPFFKGRRLNNLHRRYEHNY